MTTSRSGTRSRDAIDSHPVELAMGWSRARSRAWDRAGRCNLVLSTQPKSSGSGREVALPDEVPDPDEHDAVDRGTFRVGPVPSAIDREKLIGVSMRSFHGCWGKDQRGPMEAPNMQWKGMLCTGWEWGAGVER